MVFWLSGLSLTSVRSSGEPDLSHACALLGNPALGSPASPEAQRTVIQWFILLWNVGAAGVKVESLSPAALVHGGAQLWAPCVVVPVSGALPKEPEVLISCSSQSLGRVIC